LKTCFYHSWYYYKFITFYSLPIWFPRNVGNRKIYNEARRLGSSTFLKTSSPVMVRTVRVRTSYYTHCALDHWSALVAFVGRVRTWGGGSRRSASVDALPVLGPLQSAFNVACKQVLGFRCRWLKSAHKT